MNTINKITPCLAVFLLATASLSKADVWGPVTADSTFFTQETLLNQPSTEVFGIFAATDNIGPTATPILSFTGGDSVTFNQKGANYTLSDNVSSGILWNSNNFQIGWLDTAGVWVAASGGNQLSMIGANDYSIAFIDPNANPANNLLTLYAVNVQPTFASASTSGASAIPLPATAWLMTSILLGFLFNGRYKSGIKA
jgi:hypothetical protein